MGLLMQCDNGLHHQVVVFKPSWWHRTVLDYFPEVVVVVTTRAVLCVVTASSMAKMVSTKVPDCSATADPDTF
jgi:hypothetical protein